jgi:VCBS repeat-containing protein
MFNMQSVIKIIGQFGELTLHQEGRWKNIN